MQPMNDMPRSCMNILGKHIESKIDLRQNGYDYDEPNTLLKWH